MEESSYPCYDDVMMVPRPEDPLDAAIHYFGSPKRLAAAVGVSPQAVTNWKLRQHVPFRAAEKIEQASQGQCPIEFFYRRP